MPKTVTIEQTPVYRLLQPFFSPDDNYFPEGDEIEYEGVPNHQMEPVNEAAHQVFAEWLGSLPDEPARRNLKAEEILEVIQWEMMRSRPKHEIDALTKARAEERDRHSPKAKVQSTKRGSAPELMGTKRTAGSTVRSVARTTPVVKVPIMGGIREVPMPGPISLPGDSPMPLVKEL